MISIVGRPGSKAVKRIITNTDLYRYAKNCDFVINYGLAGQKMGLFVKNNPSLPRKPIINKYIGCSKFKAVKDAEAIGIKVPKTLLSLNFEDKKTDFLTKRLHSQGGIGIIKATGKGRVTGKYYQEFIENRRYELRVHGFLWVDEKDWCIQKRFGREGEIAWNYHNGGRFQTIQNPNDYKVFVDAKEITKKVLKMRNMAFGAVDFIVTTSGDLLFLEINSAPGFTKLSEGAYILAFSMLTRSSKSKILQYCK